MKSVASGRARGSLLEEPVAFKGNCSRKPKGSGGEDRDGELNFYFKELEQMPCY